MEELPHLWILIEAKLQAYDREGSYNILSLYIYIVIKNVFDWKMYTDSIELD